MVLYSSACICQLCILSAALGDARPLETGLPLSFRGCPPVPGKVLPQFLNESIKLLSVKLTKHSILQSIECILAWLYIDPWWNLLGLTRKEFRVFSLDNYSKTEWAVWNMWNIRCIFLFFDSMVPITAVLLSYLGTSVKQLQWYLALSCWFILSALCKLHLFWLCYQCLMVREMIIIKQIFLGMLSKICQCSDCRYCRLFWSSAVTNMQWGCWEIDCKNRMFTLVRVLFILLETLNHVSCIYVCVLLRGLEICFKV